MHTSGLDLPRPYTAPGGRVYVVGVRRLHSVDGVEAVTVTGLPSLVADQLAAITDETERGNAAAILARHTLTLFHLPGEAGRVRTTYTGEVDAVSIDDVTAAADRIYRLVWPSPEPT
ncbi:hypothetical protein [Streptomyces zhihengii]|uniref:hypothetical protein n=1 Tax=Streptomyces zhihengii TaxID=1818004 RepID=UPI00339FAAF6